MIHMKEGAEEEKVVGLIRSHLFCLVIDRFL